MRDYQAEYEGRVAFIRELVKSAGASGIVYGNSGGKDSALVGILCKAACDNTVGIIMPCASKRNYGQDTDDGIAVAGQFGIETRTVDLTAVREREMEELQKVCTLNSAAINNIAPCLRMMTLYAIGAAENRCTCYHFRRADEPLDALLAAVPKPLPGERILILNGIPESARISELSLLAEGIAAGHRAEREGKYFHPAANAAFDRLTGGRSSEIQLDSIIANARLAATL